KRSLQSWQCHVDDGAVNEHHARTEDGRGQNPRSVHSSRLGASITANRGLVAGRPRDSGHSSIVRRIAPCRYQFYLARGLRSGMTSVRTSPVGWAGMRKTWVIASARFSDETAWVATLFPSPADRGFFRLRARNV